ncbi:paramyosin-like isoform X3 [Pseudoliparis swirei]|nr:paramyosin-like isoform X3 [Pseudoliparis swirei]XP_056295474.1 paramyosin-like isoform X3 [Pseudoliparis swirei]
MDDTEENMMLKERIAELEYSLNQQKDLTTKMRHWLDVADDDVALLRSENTILKKKVKALEKVISEAQKVEAEPCKSLLADDLGVKTFRENKIQELENKTTMMMNEQNKKLTEELKDLQQERDRDHIIFSKLRAEFQTLECALEEAQLDLQKRNDAIDQNNFHIKHLEETVEEYTHSMENFRLTNKELKEKLEGRLDEASLTTLNNRMEEGDGWLSPPLSFAEEMKLLKSSAEVKTAVSDSTDLQHEETEVEELLEPQSVTLDCQTKRCAGVSEAAVLRAGRFRLLFVVLSLLFVVVLSVLAFVTSRRCPGNHFSFNTLQSFVQLVLQPYCSLHHGALPPI